jgi:hypothetical protein
MGKVSFIPGGMIATAAQAVTAGRSRGSRVRRAGRRRKRSAAKAGRSAPRASSARKPKFGTKAWMAYIRGMRGKKKRK